MLDESTRSAILRLREQGHGSRAIANALGVSRGAVREVLKSGASAVPPLDREEKAEGYRAQILELHAACKGNLVRVHEELIAAGAELSYQSLTAFCRRHGIGYDPPLPAGRYHFKPGQEMQHDTSPHHAQIGGALRRVQTASLVLCHSRMTFVQCYPRFSRFECKVFLTDALVYLGCAATRCMVDNTHLVVLAGTGRDMVPVPEMAAFGDRFGFEFVAHAVGDANRSAHVERRFHHIEHNFLAGRSFKDWSELNAEAVLWCDRINATHRRHLHASPRELFAAERAHCQPLPLYVPEVYAIHSRIVDTEGYVNVNRNRYSVPWQLLGRQLEVRETKDKIEVFEGPRRVAVHQRVLDALDARVTIPEHRPPRNEGFFARRSVSADERRLCERVPETADFVALMHKRGRAGGRELRKLLRMVDDYPRAALVAAMREATRYGMTDLDRLDRMVLRAVARDFFVVRPRRPDDDGGGAEDLGEHER